jgi:hypothetical protein
MVSQTGQQSTSPWINSAFGHGMVDKYKYTVDKNGISDTVVEYILFLNILYLYNLS